MAASLSHLKYLSAILYLKGANVRTGLYTESYKLAFLQELRTLGKKKGLFSLAARRGHIGGIALQLHSFLNSAVHGTSCPGALPSRNNPVPIECVVLIPGRVALLSDYLFWFSFKGFRILIPT